MQASQVWSTYGAGKTKPYNLKKEGMNSFDTLHKLGIGIDAATRSRFGGRMSAGDALEPLNTASASAVTPVQFLQAWAPGVVQVVTTPTTIDKLAGTTVLGNWYDEEVVQTVMEHSGEAQLYGDYTDLNRADFALSYEKRSIVRFEQGFEVGRLESARTGAMNVNAAAQKRIAATKSLEQRRNSIGFNGFNDGSSTIYGYFNDPNLPSYVTVATGSASGTTWSTKTFSEITNDILIAVNALITSSGGVIDPEIDALVLAIPVTANQYLGVVQENSSYSVRKWIRDTYPTIEIITSIELSGANGSADVFYLHAKEIRDDGSTDDRSVLTQLVPAKMQTLGSDSTIKTDEEGMANALGGILVKRPFAIVRYSGI